MNRTRQSRSMLSNETFDVGVQYPVHSLFGDPDVERIKGLMLATMGPEAIAETEEVFFLNAP